MSKKLVYICSPLRGDYEENTRRARDYCAWVMLNNPDIIPVAPHIYFPQFLDDTNPTERSLGMEAGMELLDKCSALWIFLGEGESQTEGMSAEITRACELGIPVRVHIYGDAS